MKNSSDYAKYYLSNILRRFTKSFYFYKLYYTKTILSPPIYYQIIIIIIPTFLLLVIHSSLCSKDSLNFIHLHEYVLILKLIEFSCIFDSSTGITIFTGRIQILEWEDQKFAMEINQ